MVTRYFIQLFHVEYGRSSLIGLFHPLVRLGVDAVVDVGNPASIRIGIHDDEIGEPLAGRWNLDTNVHVLAIRNVNQLTLRMLVK